MKRPSVVPRRMQFDFSEVPRHWLYGSAVITHAANGLHLLFPEGERFFIRSVRRYLGRIEDPELLARVRGFFAQEALHGKAHDEAASILERQGYEVSSFLRWYRWLAFDVVEACLPSVLCLSVTVALEHLTAVLAESAFHDGHLEHAHPEMRALLLWHSAEEIEHKSVAFDVFEAVDGRYWMRLLGMAIGVTSLLFFAGVARRRLIRADGLSHARVRREWREARDRGQGSGTIWRGVFSYLRPGFHPDDIDNYHLVEQWRATRRGGLAMSVAPA